MRARTVRPEGHAIAGRRKLRAGIAPRGIDEHLIALRLPQIHAPYIGLLHELRKDNVLGLARNGQMIRVLSVRQRTGRLGAACQPDPPNARGLIAVADKQQRLAVSRPGVRRNVTMVLRKSPRFPAGNRHQKDLSHGVTRRPAEGQRLAVWRKCRAGIAQGLTRRSGETAPAAIAERDEINEVGLPFGVPIGHSQPLAIGGPIEMTIMQGAEELCGRNTALGTGFQIGDKNRRIPPALTGGEVGQLLSVGRPARAGLAARLVGDAPRPAAGKLRHVDVVVVLRLTVPGKGHSPAVGRKDWLVLPAAEGSEWADFGGNCLVRRSQQPPEKASGEKGAQQSRDQPSQTPCRQ